MFAKLLVALGVVAVASALPPVARTRKDIEEFRTYLDRIKRGNGVQLESRLKENPTANAEEMSGRFQGDIILDDEDLETIIQEYAIGRNAYRASSITQWPDNTVVWEFAAGVFNAAQQEAIRAAIRDIEAHSCVKFRTRTASDSVYVRLTGASDGCYSHIGHRVSRGAHTMNLALNTVGVGCFRHATIVHEWMHILGFLHMHATYDRDQYVNILDENIASGSEHNFDIYGESNVNNLGLEYDYVSCLHYADTSFTRNGLPTIVALQNYSGTMGQRQYVTDMDWLRINRHYNCPGAWD